MDLYEYQGKELFRRVGIPVSDGRRADSPQEARAAAQELGGEVVVKAQVLTGGRGKAGGVKLATGPDDAEQKAKDILGLDIRGHVVRRLWIEKASDISKEYYLSIALDRGAKKPLFMFTTQGGVEIEQVAEESPDALVRLHVDPSEGFQPWVARRLIYGAGVADPSEVFGRTVPGEPGAAVACALEGTRPILLEIQALVAQSELAMPRRVATGIDPKRLAMIVAVLSRHARVPLGQADVFVNVAGGVRIDEPGADLAVALAIASAARRVPVKAGVAAFGEIGLTGRLRTSAQAERRLEECAKLGLASVVAPTGTAATGKIGVEAADTLRQAIKAGLDGDRPEGD